MPVPEPEPIIVAVTDNRGRARTAAAAFRRAPLPTALPEGAPLDIVGTSRDEFASTLVPNNVKDGTPAHRAPSFLGAGGTFDVRLSTFDR